VACWLYAPSLFKHGALAANEPVPAWTEMEHEPTHGFGHRSTLSPRLPAPKCARVDIDDLCDFLSRHEALFAGIADVELSVRQQQEMPWIRATTGELSSLKSAGLEWSRVPTNDLPIEVNTEDISVRIAVDFVQQKGVGPISVGNTWYFDHEKYRLRVSASVTDKQVATLSWFHAG
jgi:hypothetical protein